MEWFSQMQHDIQPLGYNTYLQGIWWTAFCCTLIDVQSFVACIPSKPSHIWQQTQCLTRSGEIQHAKKAQPWPGILGAKLCSNTRWKQLKDWVFLAVINFKWKGFNNNYLNYAIGTKWQECSFICLIVMFHFLSNPQFLYPSLHYVFIEQHSPTSALVERRLALVL